MSDETLTRRNDSFSEWQSSPAHDAVRNYEASKKKVTPNERKTWAAAHRGRAPLRFGHIEKVIDDSISLTHLPPDWDESGAKPILESTWQRACNALRSIARTAYRRHRYVMPAPNIGPCADGSIDLYWNGPQFTLLINVQESQDRVSDFFGERRGSKIEGPFNPENPDLSFLGSLLKP